MRTPAVRASVTALVAAAFLLLILLILLLLVVDWWLCVFLLSCLCSPRCEVVLVLPVDFLSHSDRHSD